MKVLKLGGTSLGTAQRIKNASLLVDENSINLVVLSAMSGITNYLSDAYEKILSGDSKTAGSIIENVRIKFNETAFELFEEKDPLQFVLKEIKSSIEEILNTIDLLSYSKMLSYGELITSHLFSQYLISQKRNNILLDALSFMVLTEDGNPIILKLDPN
jgi:aspartate kinase